MKVTICQLPDDRAAYDKAWADLLAHVKAEGSDLVLLPEMPAYSWFAHQPDFDPAVWQEAVAAHDRLLFGLHSFGRTAVLGTRPISRGELHINEGFGWTAQTGYQRAHDKYYFPEEPGFYETHWFQRGGREFNALPVGEALCGFLICSEAMFNERARLYGKQGAQLLVTPRATGGHPRWQVALQMAAVTAGAFVLSSNRTGKGNPSRLDFGGQGYLIDPEGTVLAVTSEAQPFLTTEIDLAVADEAKKSYPRYMTE